MTNKNKPCISTGYVTIEPRDWDCTFYLTDMAARIVADWKFDEQCRNYSINRRTINLKGSES